MFYIHDKDFFVSFLDLSDNYREGHKDPVVAISTTFSKEFRKNDTSFESPIIELLESGKKLGVASLLGDHAFLSKKATGSLKLNLSFS